MKNVLESQSYITHYMEEQWPLFHYPMSSQQLYKGQVIILGNAYGIMPYQEPLARSLSENGWEAFWFPLSGQPYTIEGETHIAQGKFVSKDLAKDLPKAVEYITNNFSCLTDSLNIIAHCVSGLIAMSYLAENPLNPIKSFISYGLLVDPTRVKARGQSKMLKVGIESILNSDVWSYNAFDLVLTLENIEIANSNLKRNF
jgi:dienelactone hydrolase